MKKRILLCLTSIAGVFIAAGENNMKKIIVTNKLLLLALAFVFCFSSCEEGEPGAKLVIKNNATSITIDTLEAWESTDELEECELQAVRLMFKGDLIGASFAARQAEKEEARIISTSPLHRYTVPILPGKEKAFEVKKETILLIRVNRIYKEKVNVSSEDTILILTDSSTEPPYWLKKED